MNDKIMFKPEHREKAERILREVRKCQLELVLIGGGAGVGKTEVALILKQLIGDRHKRHVDIIHLDQYYRVDFKKRNKVREMGKLENTVGYQEIEWDRVLQVMSVCLGCIIVEGLYALTLDKDHGVSIHLEGCADSTLAFRQERRKENPDSELRKRIVSQEFKVVNELRERSDLCI